MDLHRNAVVYYLFKIWSGCGVLKARILAVFYAVKNRNFDEALPFETIVGIVSNPSLAWM